MKKVLSIFVALMTFSGVVLAGRIDTNPLTTSSTAIVKTNTGAKVYYKSEKTGKVKVTIYDERNKEIFEEEVKYRTGFVRPYNMENLPEGNYKVVLEDEQGIIEKTISNVSVSASVLAAVINARKDLDKCMVTLYSEGKSDVTVRLLDKNRRELTSKNSTVNGQSSLLFNLANLTGVISVEVSDKAGVIKLSTLNEIE